MDMTEQTAGKLYIVATPIGNSRDMSARGIQILTDADIIAAEDTRRSMVLLNKLGIRNKLVSNHKFNEHGKAKYFISELKGCRVVDADDESVVYGELTDVFETGANDVWHVTGEDGKEYLLPAIPDVVIDADVANNRVLLRPLKGIFDDAD